MIVSVTEKEPGINAIMYFCCNITKFAYFCSITLNLTRHLLKKSYFMKMINKFTY